MAFTPQQVQEILEEYAKIKNQYENLLLDYLRLDISAEAREYADHGFGRRLKTLSRCIHRIFAICPPHRTTKPDEDELADISIHLQAFMFNLYGIFDNLAWLWVKHKNIPYKKNTEVTFNNPKILTSLSAEFQTYFHSHKDWRAYAEGFRHALAHRIPLYVPPFVLTEEETKRYQTIDAQLLPLLKAHKFEEYEKLEQERDQLGKFMPWMGHSLAEQGPVYFHPQILADWFTVEEFSRKFLHEIQSDRGAQQAA